MATKKKTAKKTAVLPDGTELTVTGEAGRYIQCGDRQFRKANVTVITAEEKTDAVPEAEAGKE